MDTFITYEGLPINSGGAHSLSKKPVEKIYLETMAFLKTFTDSDRPKEVGVTFYTSQNKSYKTLPILLSLTKRLGVPLHNSWDLGSVKQDFYTWRLKNNNIQSGFEILEKYKDLPSNPYGPVVLSLKWQFYFVDKDTKRVLPGQDKIPVLDIRQQNSQIYLRLSQKSTISVWFALPFSATEGYAQEYVNSLCSHLPFKPSEKHWKIWRKSKSGIWSPQKMR